MRPSTTNARRAGIRRWIGVGLLALLVNPAAALRVTICDAVGTPSAQSMPQMAGMDHGGSQSPVRNHEAVQGDFDCGHSMPATNCSPGIGCVVVAAADATRSGTVGATARADFLPPANGPAATSAGPDTPPPRT